MTVTCHSGGNTDRKCSREPYEGMETGVTVTCRPQLFEHSSTYCFDGLALEDSKQERLVTKMLRALALGASHRFTIGTR